jgi:hypothetical protein
MLSGEALSRQHPIRGAGNARPGLHGTVPSYHDVIGLQAETLRCYHLS